MLRAVTGTTPEVTIRAARDDSAKRLLNDGILEKSGRENERQVSVLNDTDGEGERD